MYLYLLEDKTRQIFSEREVCPESGYVAPDFTLSHFSFNSHHGACSKCHGLGHQVDFEEQNIVSQDLTLDE